MDAPLEEGSKRLTVKLADFGLAKTEDPTQETKTGLTGTFVIVKDFLLFTIIIALDGSRNFR